GAITYENVFHVGEGMSIQAAVDNAAPNATVNLAAATFPAGFMVDSATGLTIAGAGKSSTVIDATASIATGIAHKYSADTKSVVLVNESSDVTLKDFTVLTDDLVWSSQLDTIVFWNASSGLIQNLSLEGAGIETGIQTGQGLAVDASAPLASNLLVQNTDFSGWNKNAIDIVNGNGSDGTGGGNVTVNTVGGNFVGGGATSEIAQNGIVYWDRGGATVIGTVDGVTISELEYTLSGAEAAGILPYGHAVLPTISNSTFDGSVQIYISNSTPNTVDATNNNSFAGVIGSSATGAALTAIQDKIIEDPGEVTLQP